MSSTLRASVLLALMGVGERERVETLAKCARAVVKNHFLSLLNVPAI
jgi:hypothetical protein